MNFEHFVLKLPVFNPDQLLEFLDLSLILHFYAFKRLNKFLKDIDQRLSLLVILNIRLLAVSVKLHLMIQHFPELLVLINQHFQFILDFLIIILRIGRPIIVKFLDRLSEFGVDPDKFL